jgi:thiol:disulfide interchange protein DsbD
VKQDEDFTINLDDHKNAVIKNADDDALVSIFGKGFVGGLIALLTPCVFPMIPLTVSFFTKRSKKAKGVFNAFLYGIAIIVIYVGLGFLVSRIFGADALNSMATNIYFNLAFFIIFMIFAFSFLGAFEITLPSSWANKADAKADKGGFVGIFFMAFTLALVSFSCTGPIIGSLLVLAAEGGGYSGPVSGMAGFAFALALPFTLFAIFPSWMQSLPKSGGWLNSVKVSLGFIELALALKFLSTVDMAYHWDFLKREYFLAIWIIIFALLGFYLLGKLRFSHDSESKHTSVPGLLLAIIAFAFAAYMVPGLFGAPVKLLSGLAPPVEYSEGWKIGGGDQSQAHMTPGKKYGELFHCPLGLDCFFDYDQALEQARKTGKPLMVDFTGHGCVNCRKMEQNVWSDPQVLEKIKKDYILVSLYVDDKTSLPETEQFYSQALGKKVNTIGRKWSHLENDHFHNNAQPYYVLLDHNEQTLAEPRGYTPDVEEYAAFLENGKIEFQKRKSQAKN